MAQLPSTNAIPFSHMFSFVRVDFAWHLAHLPFKVHLLWVIVSLSCNLKEKARKKTERVDGSTTLHQCFPLFPYFFPRSHRSRVTSDTFTIKSASIVGNCLAIMQKQEKKDQTE